MVIKLAAPESESGFFVFIVITEAQFSSMSLNTSFTRGLHEFHNFKTTARRVVTMQGLLMLTFGSLL
jgi:hypothetical protein